MVIPERTELTDLPRSANPPRKKARHLFSRSVSQSTEFSAAPKIEQLADGSTRVPKRGLVDRSEDFGCILERLRLFLVII